MSDWVSPRTSDVISFVLRLVTGAVVGIYVSRKLVQIMDPTNDQKNKSKLIAEKILKDLGITNLTQQLTEYELAIATHVTSNNTGISWEDVGGYVEQIKDLQDNVILPLKVSCKSKLFFPPSGVLLYGPPGCGKTLIAKAVAKAAGARFINLQVSTLTDKWYGESNKLVSAIFTLAGKLQPAIIFIDEIDSFLRSRASSDHEATAMMKALFMSSWDGFSSQPDHRIIVLGATNRPEDVDPAILRRMPCRLYVGLPDKLQRKNILEVILKNENVDPELKLDDVAEITGGFSGSDLKEIVRIASIRCVKDAVLIGQDNTELEIRPMSFEDFRYAVEKSRQCHAISKFTNFQSMPVD